MRVMIVIQMMVHSNDALGLQLVLPSEYQLDSQPQAKEPEGWLQTVTALRFRLLVFCTLLWVS